MISLSLSLSLALNDISVNSDLSSIQLANIKESAFSMIYCTGFFLLLLLFDFTNNIRFIFYRSVSNQEEATRSHILFSRAQI